MSSKLELYYFPGSYYSQKAFLTLHEKQLTFTEHLVFIAVFGEQNEDWFLRINPAGLVPAIKDGDDVICESETIIDYLDKKPSSGPGLVPDVGTALGERVARLRKFLHELPIEEVTYLVFLHPSLMIKETKELKMMQNVLTKDKYEKYLRCEIANFERKREANPALQETMTKKIARYQWKLDFLFNEANGRGVLADFQKTFDRIEQELAQSQADAQTEEVWLCGTSFTAADVTMVVLLSRMQFIGIEEEYYSATKRPKVFAYCNRVFARSAVKKLHENISTEHMARLFKIKMAKLAAKKVAKAVLVVGALAALAYGVKKYVIDKAG